MPASVHPDTVVVVEDKPWFKHAAYLDDLGMHVHIETTGGGDHIGSLMVSIRGKSPAWTRLQEAVAQAIQYNRVVAEVENTMRAAGDTDD